MKNPLTTEEVGLIKRLIKMNFGESYTGKGDSNAIIGLINKDRSVFSQQQPARVSEIRTGKRFKDVSLASEAEVNDKIKNILNEAETPDVVDDRTLNWEDVMNSLGEEESTSILFGNGLAISYDESFNQKNILSDKMTNIWDDFSYEKIKNYIEKSFKTFKHYDLNVTDDLANIAGNSIKKDFVSQLTKNHPESQWDIPKEKINALKSNIENFSSIYTLNNDLLLLPLRIQNGFGYCRRNMSESEKRQVFHKEGDCKIYNIHGALHFFETCESVKCHGATVDKDNALVYLNSNAVEKIENNGYRLIEQVQEEIQSGRYPLLVVGSTAEEKMLEINKNIYLKHCYEKLESERGGLVVFGHSFADNDKHIYQAIEKSAVSNLYVGLHGDQTKELFYEKLNDWGIEMSANIYFYDLNSINLWEQEKTNN